MNQGGPTSRTQSFARARDIAVGVTVGLLVAVGMETAAHTKSNQRTTATTTASANGVQTVAISPWIEQAITSQRAALARARTTEEGRAIEASIAPVSAGYVSVWSMRDDDSVVLRCAALDANGTLRRPLVAVTPSDKVAWYTAIASVGDRVVVAWMDALRTPPFTWTPMWAVVDRDCSVRRPASLVGFAGRRRLTVDVAFDGERVAFVSRALDRSPDVQLAIRSLDGREIANETIAVEEPGLFNAVTAVQGGFLVAFDEVDFARSKGTLRTARVSLTGTPIQTNVLHRFDGPLAFVRSVAGSERGFVWGEDGIMLMNRYEAFFARVRANEALSPLRLRERSTSSERDAACNARGCLHAWISVGPAADAQPRFVTEFRDIDGRVERGPTEHAIEGAGLWYPPSVAASADGTSFLAVVPSPHALYAQRFDQSGRPQGSPVTPR